MQANVIFKRAPPPWVPPSGGHAQGGGGRGYRPPGTPQVKGTVNVITMKPPTKRCMPELQ